MCVCVYIIGYIHFAFVFLYIAHSIGPYLLLVCKCDSPPRSVSRVCLYIYIYVWQRISSESSYDLAERGGGEGWRLNIHHINISIYILISYTLSTHSLSPPLPSKHFFSFTKKNMEIELSCTNISYTPHPP